MLLHHCRDFEYNAQQNGVVNASNGVIPDGGILVAEVVPKEKSVDEAPPDDVARRVSTTGSPAEPAPSVAEGDDNRML